MKPLALLPNEEARRLLGLLFDLDDTLLTHGVLTRQAYGALWDLADSGLYLVAVTGRPSGWGEVFARQWPIAGCVAENGAVHWARRGRALELLDSCADDERRRRRARLDSLVLAVRQAVPSARLTDDCHARRSDVTWDIAERAKLPRESVSELVLLIESAGARHTESSVHLHATFDSDDKASGAIRFCAREFGVEPTLALTRFGFVGDSGNDLPCFSAFRSTFAVANVRSSLPRFTLPPRYVSQASMGEGFAEIAAALVAKRGRRGS